MARNKKRKSKGVNWWRVMDWVVGVEFIGVVGGVITAGSVATWYAGLNKPAFSPPNFVFGPVWTLLYAMLGVVGYLLWQDRETKKLGMIKRLFLMQLALNALWSPVFFGFRSILLALLIIVLMWVCLVWLIVKLQQTKPTVVVWLLPYLVWISFAMVLNASVWWLN